MGRGGSPLPVFFLRDRKRPLDPRGVAGMKQLAGMLCVLVMMSFMAPAIAATPDTSRQTKLLYLLKHDCGSCHGMTRKGGLGPPLLPENLRGKPGDMLVITVLDGRPGTPMPPWRGELSEADARWLVEALRTGAGL